MTNFTAFVGRNDIGKSTILGALDLFFEGGTVSLDRSDVCKQGRGTCVRIGCTFEVADGEVVLDASAFTTLAGEYLLNAGGHLEIVEVWDCAGARPTLKVFARAEHPSAPGFENLLAAKQLELRRLVQQRQLDCDLNANPGMRRAL